LDFGGMGANANANANAASGQTTPGGGVGGATGKFVDPLLMRKKERESMPGPPRLGKPVGKTSFGDLLAFFDERKGA
jgi:hypothetical protein